MIRQFSPEGQKSAKNKRRGAPGVLGKGFVFTNVFPNEGILFPSRSSDKKPKAALDKAMAAPS